MTGAAVSPGALLAIAAAGGVGAALRYATDVFVKRRFSRGPLGILLVNVLASLAIGALAGLGLAGASAVGDETTGLILASGLLGGFSTFSTVAVDAAELLRSRRWAWLAMSTVGMLALSLGACWAGYAVVDWWR